MAAIASGSCASSFSTDEGLVGWAEYYDGFSGTSLAPLIESFGRTAAGLDPCQYARLSETLHATTRLASGGLAYQAIAAIENACLDVAAKARGVPVYALFGGAFRDRIGVYWTHCGSYRVLHAAFYERIGMAPVRTLDDFVAIGREAASAGFKVLKTNPVFFGANGARMINGGFRIAPGFLDRSITDAQIEAVVDQLSALRQGAGPAIGLMLDTSFSQRTEGYLRLARPPRIAGLVLGSSSTFATPRRWLSIRARTRTPIASLESLHGLAEYRPYIEQRGVDVALVDPLWNGVWQSIRIATLADAYETHVAPHNPDGELGNLMSAHFCASIPNLRIAGLRPDEAPWTRSFVSHCAEVVKGELLVPDRPGWGADVVEEALLAHPPARP